MKKKNPKFKEEMVIFRTSTKNVKSLDRLAELIGASRSEALRRLIPDLSSKTDVN